MRPGAAIYIGPNEPHRVVNTGRTPLQVLVSTPLAHGAAASRPRCHWRRPKAGEPALKLLVVFDGGSEGNPGRGYGSFHVEAPGRRPQVERREYKGLITNNEAEYLTLIAALEYILDCGAKERPRPQAGRAGHSRRQPTGDQADHGGVENQNDRMRALADQCHLLLRRFGRWHLTWHERAESVELLGH